MTGISIKGFLYWILYILVHGASHRARTHAAFVTNSRRRPHAREGVAGSGRNDGSNSGIGGAGGNSSRASRPFVVAAVVLVFAGSLTGSAWMMSLFGVALPSGVARLLALHRTFQIDGFLTLLIMGIGYMIVPRFRNAPLPSARLARVSFVLVAGSVAVSAAVTASMPGGDDGGGSGSLAGRAASMLRLAGVSVFAGSVFWMVRTTRPRLLGLADSFVATSAGVLLALAALHAAGARPASALAEIQALLLFPVLMIFGVEYKTMPSFLGFIRPRKRAGEAAALLAVAAGAAAIVSAYADLAYSLFFFNAALMACAALFALSIFVFGGFDNSEILRLISGEKKTRYVYTASYSRLSFLFLFAGVAFAAAFSLGAGGGSGSGGGYAFALYDLAIHFTAIGFIGTTIALYLPLMLPPITGRAVRFEKFSHAPVLLLVSSLLIRAAGDAAMAARWTAWAPGAYVFMSSVWLVVAALAAFVVMLHRSMRP